MIESGKLHPERLIGRTISLEESTSVLANMNTFAETGVAIINQF
jgi:alcohol dehydrogenase